MEVYRFEGWKDLKVSFSDHPRADIKNVPFNCSSPESTLPWLSLVIKETHALWGHIKSEVIEDSRLGSSKGLSLPFPISLEPEISVGDIFLRAGSAYLQLLKCLAH